MASSSMRMRKDCAYLLTTNSQFIVASLRTLFMLAVSIILKTQQNSPNTVDVEGPRVIRERTE